MSEGVGDWLRGMGAISRTYLTGVCGQVAAGERDVDHGWDEALQRVIHEEDQRIETTIRDLHDLTSTFLLVPREIEIHELGETRRRDTPVGYTRGSGVG